MSWIVGISSFCFPHKNRISSILTSFSRGRYCHFKLLNATVDNWSQKDIFRWCRSTFLWVFHRFLQKRIGYFGFQAILVLSAILIQPSWTLIMKYQRRVWLLNKVCPLSNKRCVFSRISFGCCGRFTAAELLSFSLSVMLVLIWVLTGHWLLMDGKWLICDKL